MMLADLGANVIRIDHPEQNAGNPLPPQLDLLNRGKKAITINLKSDDGIQIARRLVDNADILIEGFRPGVAERLGLGPKESLERNPRLVYGRMTGWGQDGPLSTSAGHDINYIAVAGALAHIGPAHGPPSIPLNMIGDFGGGGMLLAFGVMSAVFETNETGIGQVVDAAIVDGAALLTTMQHAWMAHGLWSDQRGTNMLDGGAHFYGVYECSDGRYLSVGAIEPRFYAKLLDGLGLANDEDFIAGHSDSRFWPRLIERLAEIFGEHPLEHWLQLLGDQDTCVAPVLTIAEATTHPHNRKRRSFIQVSGVTQPAPAPRFSRSQSQPPTAPAARGEHTREILTNLGLTPGEVQELIANGSVEARQLVG